MPRSACVAEDNHLMTVQPFCHIINIDGVQVICIKKIPLCNIELNLSTADDAIRSNHFYLPHIIGNQPGHRNSGEVYGSFEAYQEQIDRLQLGSRIYLYHHYIPDTEVAVYFSAADVVVLPYRSATQSGIVQIAYHYQLPVIVTAVGGLTEMVTDGVTGLVIPPGNPGAVADAIRRFFENHSDGQMEREIAARAPDFSWSGFAGELLALARS